ncbi:MAG: U32 family peptidase [Elusimicrobiales bacterium]
MKIVSGVNNIKECEILSSISDEFYFGLKEVENHRKWYSFLNIKDTDEAEKLIKTAQSQRKKIYIAANETYDKTETSKAVEIIEKLIKKGLSGIILRDINLAEHFKNKTEIILSSTALVFNSNSLKFYKELTGLKRLVIPQHLKPEEQFFIKKIKDIEYEIFYFPDVYCSNIDGACLYHDFDGIIRKKTNCSYVFMSGKQKIKMAHPSAKKRFETIYNYYKLGANYIKTARDGTTEEKIKILKKIKTLISIMEKNPSKKVFYSCLKKYFNIYD